MNKRTTFSRLNMTLLLSLSAIIPVAYSQDIANNASVNVATADSSILTARGTRTKNCCLETAQAETNQVAHSMATRTRRGNNRGSSSLTPSSNNQNTTAWHTRRSVKKNKALMISNSSTYY